ncbi:IS3 family transposase [Subtercola endophyticus]|uniref:IS3 family transposase n=1 Tax=Subtercola endophyticus TaxID=2895559 RepID=UPI0021041BC2|nr:IS3 family transposase [Subtercola endophyticus]
MQETAVAELVAAGLSVSAACAAAGVPRASWYRRRHRPRGHRAPVPQSDRFQPAALSVQERARIVAYLCDEEYADLSVTAVFYRLLDEGIYIASQSSWHRIARQRQLTGDRRRQATHPPAVIPVLCATGPNQVWSWDITMLPSTDRGRSFKLYLILDVYSRYVVGWRVEDAERATLAVAMLTDAIAANSVPEVLHADRGPSMTSDLMTETLGTLGIVKSHSRPHVSNDNPFSEAQFKTMKYALDYPRRFDTLEHARHWIDAFIRSYNTEHHHSGIGHYTPETVHNGTWRIYRNRRQSLLNTAYQQHPERYNRRPQAEIINIRTWINQPTTELSHTG